MSELACDLLVLSGDWIPDNELAVTAGLPIDAGSMAPIVDTAGRTPKRAVFAAGNLVHPAETADIAALGGRHVAASVLDFLRAPEGWPLPATPIASADLRWITPQLVPQDRTLPARRRFVVRARDMASRAAVTIRQGESELWHGRAQLIPNRSASLPAEWLAAVDADEPVTVSITNQRRPDALRRVQDEVDAEVE